jgi:transcriptional regulator with XRE-family HTH domain
MAYRRNHAVRLPTTRTDNRAGNNAGVVITKDIVMEESNPPSEPGNTPGARIRWARYQENLTIKELSCATGLSETFLIYVENNHSKISITSVRLIAAALKQPIWFINCLEDLPAETLAQRIRKSRLYLGLTKREFAAQIGVHEKTVKHWEDGRLISSKTRRLLADRFNI